MKEEKLTHEILEKFFNEQNRLIAEGKIEKPKRIIRDFTPEEQKMFDEGFTFEEIFNDLDKEFGVTDC